jgi:hypothetical protein
MKLNLTLGVDSAARKLIPIVSGFLNYFPAAVAGAARHSVRGNAKHNPGEPLHHARGKSTDHSECVVRHTMDINDMLAYLERNRAIYDREVHDLNGYEIAVVKQLLEEADALVWRAAAWSQELHEKFGGAPLAPGASQPSKTCGCPGCMRAPIENRMRL